MLTINGKVVVGEWFAYDGCHKCYVCKNTSEVREAQELGYIVYPIDKLPKIWEQTCMMRFITAWDLTEFYVKQFEDAEFGETPMFGVEGMRECINGITNLSIYKQQ